MLGRRSEMPKAQKLKIFTFAEFIDTDGHGFGWVVGCAGS